MCLSIKADTAPKANAAPPEKEASGVRRARVVAAVGSFPSFVTNYLRCALWKRKQDFRLQLKKQFFWISALQLESC